MTFSVSSFLKPSQLDCAALSDALRIVQSQLTTTVYQLQVLGLPYSEECVLQPHTSSFAHDHAAAPPNKRHKLAQRPATDHPADPSTDPSTDRRTDSSEPAKHTGDERLQKAVQPNVNERHQESGQARVHRVIKLHGVHALRKLDGSIDSGGLTSSKAVTQFGILLNYLTGSALRSSL